jgi:filamentous hemagglutinin
MQAARVPDKNGFTRGGRALQKHANRAGSPWQPFLPNGALNPANYNAHADELIMDILTDPNTTSRTRPSGYYGNIEEYITPDGRGLRFDINGNFIGFLDNP